MATVLERYRIRQQQLQRQMEEGQSAGNILWPYGELAYRISVLETCQSYSKTAPVTMETGALNWHYQMLDVYIQNLALERSYGPMRGPDTEKERNAARTNLGRVIEDYRKRFSSFAPSRDTAYREEIDRLMKALMPVWLQMRETFVPLEEKKKEGKH